MIARVARLVRAEFIKLFSHPFIYVALVLLSLFIGGAEELNPRFWGYKETVWRQYSSFVLFGYGFRHGLWAATLILLVFSCMSFAGEFDRGTVKNLLTRPVTRTDFFAAKCVTIVFLAVLLYVFTFYMSSAYALGRGELGPIWDKEVGQMDHSYGEMVSHARKAVLMCFPPFLAVAFFGILVSNLTESSGYAVAIGLVVYIVTSFLVGWLAEAVQQKVFFYYAGYAMETFHRLAMGEGTRWSARVDEGRLYLTVPALYIAAFLPGAYVIFRRRNIQA